MKICSICNEEFDPTLQKKQGRVCKPCVNQKRKDYYHSKEKHDPDDIQKNRDKTKEWYSKQPQDALKEKRQEYYTANKDSILGQQKSYVEANRESVSDRQRDWRERNQEHLKAYREEVRDERLLSMKEWREHNKEHVKHYWNGYYEANKETLNLKKLEWADSNMEHVLQWRKDYYQKNREEILKRNRKWCEENKDKRTYYQAQREARKLKAMPAWLTKEEKEQMKAVYKTCQRISLETGILHHVDHIHPLRGKYVCGLHVPWNLQILTASENESKGNKLMLSDEQML